MPAGLMLHVPPTLASASVLHRPTHTLVVPVIGEGSGVTVTTIELLQPVPSDVVMVVVPVATPVTTPVTACTVATDCRLLLHAPPGDDDVSVVV